MRKILLLFIIFVLSTAPVMAQENFNRAKAQLSQDYASLLKTAELVAGTAAVGLVGYVVNRTLNAPLSLLDVTARLSAPVKGHSKSAQYLMRQKNKLQKDAFSLSKVAAMAKQRQEALSSQSALYEREWRLTKKYKRLQHESDILQRVFEERYEAFNRNFTMYKADYKEFVRTGKIRKIESPVIKIPASQASSASKQILRRGGKALPLAVLLVWAASSELSAQEAAMARRMGQQPALLLSLTEEEENKIKNSPVLTQMYIQTAWHIHQLCSLSAAQWHALAQEHAGEEFSSKQLPLLRRELIKTLAQ